MFPANNALSSYQQVTDCLQTRRVKRKLHQFLHVPYAYDRGSVLLWRRCNTLCISGFVDGARRDFAWALTRHCISN